MKLVLKHLPIRVDSPLFGISHDNNNEAHIPRNELQRQRRADCHDVEQFVDIFFTDYQQGMVFSVFKDRIMNISSEPYFAIISHFQELIPCYKNYLRGRSNYKALAARNSSFEQSLKQVEIAMPALIKSKQKLHVGATPKHLPHLFPNKSVFPHKDKFKVVSPKFRHHSVQELEKILEITPIGMEDPS